MTQQAAIAAAQEHASRGHLVTVMALPIVHHAQVPRLIYHAPATQ